MSSSLSTGPALTRSSILATGITLAAAALAVAAFAVVFVAGSARATESATKSANRSTTQFATTTAASSGDRVRALALRQFAKEGKCDEALAEMAEVRAALPDDAGLALVEGQCRIRAIDYEGALAALTDARAAAPHLRDVDLFRAIALYHLEGFGAARQALDAARDNLTSGAIAHFELYEGMLLLREERPRDAALSLERARVADATQVEPIASYYAGLAWQSINERDLARDAFQRVVDRDGEDGLWGRRAATALESESLDDRTWASLRAGLEYDTNVLLLGEQLPSAAVSDQNDGRAVWFVEAGTEVFRTEKWSGGVLANYAGSAHFELNEFDVHYPRGGLWLDRELGKDNMLRLRYQGGFGWVDYAPFVTTHDASLTLYHGWGEAGRTEFFGGWNFNDFHYALTHLNSAVGGSCVGGVAGQLCAPEGLDTRVTFDRDGNGLSLGALHRYRVRALQNDFIRPIELRGGYAYRRYWADGQDWDYQGHLFRLGLESDLPWDIAWDNEISFTYRPFDNPSSLPAPPPGPPIDGVTPYTLSSDNRSDKIFRLGTELEKPIYEWLSVSARYSYMLNSSNVIFYDYDRHVVGGYVTLSF